MTTPLTDTQVASSYIELRTRIIELLRSAAPEDAKKVVPHCPKWTVQQLVAHMLGVPEDILASRMDGVTTEAWTQSQVDRHVGQSLAELAETFEALAVTFDPILHVIPAPINSQFVMDSVTHEHDLRHALNKPGARDSLAVQVAVDWLTNRAVEIIGAELFEKHFGKLELFDQMRALSGRRSIVQLAELGFSESEFEKLFGASPLKPPSISINE